MHQSVEELKALVENDPQLFMQANQMLEQVPNTEPFDKDPRGIPQVRDYTAFLKAIDDVLVRAPEYSDKNLGIMGLPFSAIINWPIGTKSGNTFFSNQKVNDQVGKIFLEWAKFLSSDASTYSLNDSASGWFCQSALDSMTGSTAGNGRNKFKDEFLCDIRKEHWGFQSWDDFFTRQFRRDARLTASPGDWNIIAHACEASPYRTVTEVHESDRFWIKGQHYSLHHMFDGHPLSASFAGGTVYQGFLNVGNYHRWHSPVDGSIKEIKHITGTYLTKLQNEGFDTSNPVDSQAYVSEVSSRVLIFLQADNPNIGLLCVMPVGWVEVSTCEVTVQTGQRVAKGEQLGMFHFGGSTHCLIFRPGVRLEFDLRGQAPGLEPKIIPVKSKIATVVTDRTRNGV